ncbi:hypothetical protein GQ600_5534 [Phytophthora cactorum]|nr:hypothetical protein GQ600_5534 [Phytophthora cactorum]
MKLFLGTSTCLYSDVEAMGRPSSRIFLTITALPQFHATCDQIYLQRVASITSKFMAALVSRIRRSNERTDALNVFRDLCQKVLISDDVSLADIGTNSRGGRYHHKLSPTKEVEMECLLQLQRDAVALIEQTLGSPNVYFGMWNLHCGFSALYRDPQLPQYLKEQEISQQHSSEQGQKLKYFGGSNPPQGPFACVPIPFVGVLSVDIFPGAAGGVFSSAFPEDGVVTFLEKVANYLGENIRTLAATDAKTLLPTLFRGNRTTFPLLFQEILATISRNLVLHLICRHFGMNGINKMDNGAGRGC